jgi:hypothetical protein
MAAMGFQLEDVQALLRRGVVEVLLFGHGWKETHGTPSQVEAAPVVDLQYDRRETYCAISLSG